MSYSSYSVGDILLFKRGFNVGIVDSVKENGDIGSILERSNVLNREEHFNNTDRLDWKKTGKNMPIKDWKISTYNRSADLIMKDIGCSNIYKL